MKISEFIELEGVTARGITCRVKGMEYVGVTPSYYQINLEGKNLFQEGFYEGNDIQDCINCLREIGFYNIEIKIKDSRSLIDVLKQDIIPKKFNNREYNYYFQVIDEDDALYVSWENSEQVFNGFYFEFTGESNERILEEYINENEITIKQIQKAISELGWI